MKKHRLIAIILILLPACLLLPSATARAAPHRQTPTITLQIRNESQVTICQFFATAVLSPALGINHLAGATIAADVAYSLSIPPGTYDLIAADCTGTAMALQPRVSLSFDYIMVMPISQDNLRRAPCDLHYHQGTSFFASDSYAHAVEKLQAALACYDLLDDHDGKASTLNTLASVYHAQGRYPEALARYHQALPILRQLGDLKGEARLLTNMGLVYTDHGRYAEAMTRFEQALTMHQQVGDRAGEAFTLSHIADIDYRQGHYQVALTNYAQALVIHRELDDLAQVDNTLAALAAIHYAQGRYNQALTLLEEALLLARETGDRAVESVIFNSMGLIYNHQGRFVEALTSHQHALSVARAIGARLGEGRVLHNIAGVYDDRGDYGAALETLQQALVILETLGDQAGVSSTLNQIGLIYNKQGRYHEALAHFETALAMAQTIGDRAAEGRVLHNIASIYKVQGNSTEALAAFQTALAIRRELGDRAEESVTLHNIGWLYVALGQEETALTYYQQALALQRAIGSQIWMGATLNNIGQIYRRRGQYALAQTTLQEALQVRRAVADRAGAGETLGNLGALFAAQGRTSTAIANYDQALDLIESVRAIAGSESGRARFFDQHVHVYDQLFDLYLQQDQRAAAFLLSERARARTFLDSLSTGYVELFDNAANTQLVRENEAYTTRQAAHDALASAKALTPPDPALVADLEAQLTAAETAYATAFSAIQARQDGLADLVPGRTQNVLSVAAVQKQLDPQTTLVSYWLLKDKAVAFLVTANAFTVVELPDATMDTIATAVVSLYQWHNRENPHPRPLRLLYQWLVAPLADHLHTPQVVIVPHQWLHYVPFAALTDGEHYFGEQHTLSLLPSASVLPFLAQNAARAQANAGTQALVFGNPQSALPALPAAAAEAQAVASLLATTVYTAAQASEVRLRATLTGTAILHLAAHGEYNLANPLYSALHLTAAGADDGRLETHEIFGLALRTNRLVILSACQTNLNELTDTSQVAVSRGDEIVSLTRAFFFAGAPTVISSLWNVDDAATETLMVSFYRHWLEEGMSKAAALQAAQAEVRANLQWVSPFYWAGFVLNGDPGAAS